MLDKDHSIIVTGGAGFIGSAVLWGLNNEGYENILVVDNLASSEKWRNLVNRRYRRYLHRDQFMEFITQGKLKEKPQAIIHLGACSSTTERNADFLMTNNTEYSKELCRYALEQGARMINASSAATYGDGQHGFMDGASWLNTLQPLNMYAYSKHLVDLWLWREKLLDQVASLKFFNVYGPNEYHKGDMASVIYKGYHEIRKTGKLRLFKSNSPHYVDGGQMRDFVYVKDCVSIILFLLDNPQVNGIMNVGTGKARSWKDLAHALFNAMGLPANIEYVEMPASLSAKYQNFTQADMNWLNHHLLFYEPTSLEDGVEDYVKNYLQKGVSYL